MPCFLARIIDVDVPRIVIQRVVHVKGKDVSAFAGFENGVSRTLVGRFDQSCVRRENVADILIFEHKIVGFGLRRKFRFHASAERGERERRQMGADDRASVFMLDGKLVTGVVEHAETVPGFGKFDKSRDAAGERVENGRGAVGFREKFICRALHQRVAEIEDFRMLFLGRLVDHSDGGAGNDVMELIEQQKFPCAVEFFRRVVREGEHGAEEFGLREHLFAFPVSPLGPRLRGERSPVKFQIEFALPDGRFSLMISKKRSARSNL